MDPLRTWRDGAAHHTWTIGRPLTLFNTDPTSKHPIEAVGDNFASLTYRT